MSDDMLSKLLQSKKYRGVCPDTIRRVWDECRAKYKKPRDADRAAREALHGITGAFLTPDEAKRLAWDMQDWSIDRTDAKLVRMLSRHASTRERLPLPAMDALYARIFGVTGKTDHILDLACGINPIYLGARGPKTTGVDISGDAISQINAFGETYGMPVRGLCADLMCPGGVPRERFDLALLFKVLPLIERQRTGAALALMEQVNARFIAASFPTRTLGGRNVGMAANYSKWMEAHLPANRKIADKFETENELFYLLKER